MPLLPFGAIPPKTNVGGSGITVVNGSNTSTISLAAAGPSQYIGTLQIYNANTNWQTNAASWSNFPAISSQSTTTVLSGLSAPGTNIPGFVMSGNAGLYQITVNGYVTLAGSALGSEGSLRISDGTNYSLGAASSSGGGTTAYGPDGSYVFNIYEPTAFTNLTFQLQGYTGNTSDYIEIYANSASVNLLETLNFDVVCFPLNSIIGAQIAMQATGSVTGGQSSGAVIIFPTVNWDTNSGYNNSTGEYVAPLTGYYMISGFINASGSNAGIYGYVNGSMATHLGITPGGNGNFVGMVYAVSGQTIDVRPDTSIGASGSSNFLSINYIR